MTQEQKQLLLKDLCARIPYETRVRYSYAFAGAAGINEYSTEGTLSYDKLQDFSLPNVGYERRRVVCILPYLRPMSSMTEEEKHELYNIRPYFINSDNIVSGTQCNTFIQASECQDWLNTHHFDYRGLIEKGLALEAPEGMY